MTASPGAITGPTNSLLDVAGLRVGQHTAIGDGFRTGTTVVLAPEGGMVAGVDVRGGGPATHETDLLEPTASVQRIHALVLTGGSAYGLAACTGVMLALAEHGIGLQVGRGPGEVVPLVPGAALFRALIHI
jgi:L-aminopeptidase/D-esterase-like protein